MIASDNAPSTRQWQRQNGSSWDNVGSSSGLEITVSQTGTYRVVTSSSNCSDQIASIVVSAISPPFSLSFSSSTQTVAAGSALSITVNGAPSGASFSWTGPNSSSFSGNPITVSSQATPQHEGRYNVTASVGSCTTSAYVDVLVQAPCVAGVTATPQVACDSSGTATVTFTTSAAAPSGYRFQYKTVLVQQDSLSGQWVDATESNWQSSNVFAQLPDGRYKVKLRTRIDNQNDLFQPHHISEVCATSSEFDVACTQFTCDYYIKAVDANGQEVSKLTLTQGTTTCEAYINLSGTPCSPIASAPCGSVPTIDIVGGSTEAGPYLTGLAVGDEFTATDYTVTVTSLYSAGGDTYSGEGYVTVKLVGGTSVDITVEFADIKINDCYQLVVGTVKSMYDPSWSNVADVFESLQNILNDIRDVLKVYDGSPQQKQQIYGY